MTVPAAGPVIVVGAGLAGLAAWELVVRLNQIPYYILPGPLLVGQTLVRDWGTLYPSLLVTLAITGSALLVATVAGVLISVLFTQSKWIELSPFFQLEKVTTPTLVVCGQEDWNVPLINSEQLYQALRRMGKTTEQ